MLVVKNLPANAGDVRDVDLSPWLGRSLGERNSNPLQYSCLENSMDREHMCLKESDTTEHVIINYRHVQVLRLYILFSSFTFSFESLTDISSIVIFPLVNVSI